MKIDIVEFEECESVYGMYVNGKLRISGDGYHNQIRDWIDGYIAAQQDNLGINNVEVLFHFLTDESQDKFADDGFSNFPETFPFTEYELQT